MNVLTRQNVTQMRYVQTLLDPIAVSAAMVILVMDKLAKVDLYRFIDETSKKSVNLVSKFHSTHLFIYFHYINKLLLCM